MQTDFGYLRPDWILLDRVRALPESGGGQIDATGWRSAMGERCQIERGVRFTDSFWRMAAGDVIHEVLNLAFGWRYPGYRRNDARPHPFSYLPRMALQLALARSREEKAQQECRRLWESGCRYFVVPLQLEHDYQIVAFSGRGSLRPFVEEIVESFARHAHPEDRLLFKVHPWDPGVVDWRLECAAIARKHGVADRLSVIRGGDLDSLLRAGAGVVTVNSTVGVRAMQLGVATICLGRAAYDQPGLTWQDGLDRFWRHGSPPDPDLALAFERHIARERHVRGVFFSEPGRTRALDEMAEVLSRPPTD